MEATPFTARLLIVLKVDSFLSSVGQKFARASNLLGYVIERVACVTFRRLICLHFATSLQNLVAGRLFAGRTP